MRSRGFSEDMIGFLCERRKKKKNISMEKAFLLMLFLTLMKKLAYGLQYG